MRLYYILLKSSLRKRKIFSLSIFLLSILVPVIGGTVLSALHINSIVYDKIYNKTQSPDLLICFSGVNFKEEYIDELNNIEGIEEVKIIHEIYTNIKDNNNKNIMGLIRNDYQMNLNLKNGEIYLSNYFKKTSQFKIGDRINISINSYSKDFIVKGFYNDPIFGSSIMKYNQLIISKEDYNKIINSDAITDVDKKEILYINWDELVDNNELSLKISEKMNEFSGSSSAEFLYDKFYIKKAYIMIPNIISIALLLATAFITCSSVYVLRYALLNTIEADFKEIGILKAMGMRYLQIKKIYINLYMMIIIFGVIIGNGFACIFSKKLSHIYLNINGLESIKLVGETSSYIGTIISLLFILFNFGIVWIGLNRVKKIAPVQVGFINNYLVASKKFTLDITKILWLPLSFRISLKQIQCKIRQYVSIIVITILFSFLMLSILALNNSFKNKEEVYNLLGLPKNDIIISSSNIDKMDKITEEIKSEFNVDFYESFTQNTLQIDTQNAVALIYGEIPNSIKLIDGDIPRKSNEIILATSLKHFLNKNIGDVVQIKSNDGNTKRYIIKGLYQTVNNLGMEFTMLHSGYKNIRKDELISQKVIQLKDPSEIEYVVSKYENNLLNVSVLNGRSGSENLIKTVKNALEIMTKSIFVISAILSSLISFLLTLVSIEREGDELRIFRLIGFKIVELRVQYIIRILVAVLIAFSAGCFLYVGMSGYMFNSLMDIVGISNISVDLSINEYIYILLLLLLIDSLISMIATKRICRYKYVKEKTRN